MPFTPTRSLGASALVLVLLCSITIHIPAAAQVAGGRLPTRWDKAINPTAPLPEYPRPQMTRKQWQSLNGPWQFTRTPHEATVVPPTFGGTILVPFPYEAALSGASQGASIPDRKLWYKRAFTIPAAWKGQHVLLHFGAVNWESAVSVNGKTMGTHKGGYDPIDLDITDALKPGDNQLIVSAYNPMPVDAPNGQVMGKQRVHPGGIFYTGVTGIWQSVWLEPVPAMHLASLQLVPDVDAKKLTVTAVTASGEAIPITVTAMDAGKTVATVKGTSGTRISLPITSPHLWTPADPHLYDLKVSLAGGDSVNSYFAMRKISLGKDEKGIVRILLNNKFVPQIGLLDQGYWPDGIYTAPTDAALRYDIQEARALGYNLLRKHAKVEPDRWYFWADKLGMLVWQDMPQAFGDLNDEAKAQWVTEWKREVSSLYNHPSIVVWTTFNEGWGEGTFDVPGIVALTRQLDPTRLIDNASGWTDKDVGDIHDTHAYPGPWSETAAKEAPRAVVNGEYGGITMRVAGHMWTADVFGYGATLSSSWTVTQRYQSLLKTAYRLMQADQHGTSAFVYTQLTDVEQESNGILTYDRAVVKPLAAIVTAANKGRFLPLPPKPVSKDPVPTSQDDPQTWQYTTDKPADGWQQPTFDASTWKSGPAPFGQGYAVGTDWHTPDIWLRREVTLPATLPTKLSVTVIHDEDVEVYVNGVLAASATGYIGDYAALPLSDAARAALHPGKNLLVAHCRQTVGGQIIDLGITAAP